MPIYTYRCSACDKKFDISHKITDNPVVTCPDCKKDCTRVPSVGAVTFRGNGWGHQ